MYKQHIVGLHGIVKLGTHDLHLRGFAPEDAQSPNGAASGWAARLGKRLMCVDFIGYHSRRYPDLPVTLPSQQYGFDLVSQAMARGRVIVIGRGARLWKVAVPDLADYSLAFELTNPRAAYLSRKGLGRRGFEAVLSALSDR